MVEPLKEDILALYLKRLEIRIQQLREALMELLEEEGNPCSQVA